MEKLTFVTGNANKVKEARDILGNLGIAVEQDNCGYPELQEDSLDPIARYGARYAADLSGKEVIVEDAGLFIDALGGFPGPYSAYVANTIGNPGILKLLEDVGEGDRGAKFMSVVGYCKPNGTAVTFCGFIEGTITHTEEGTGGFGFDPIFAVDGITFGIRGDEEKNTMSHRSKSLQAFAKWYVNR